MKKYSFVLLPIVLLLSFSQATFAQKINAADMKKLQAKEDTLKEYSYYLNTDTLQEDRMVSDSVFTKVLVRALLVKNSFYYPFDSVLGISKIYSPDTSFRIITWSLTYDDYYSRQRGAIQMRKLRIQSVQEAIGLAPCTIT